MSAFRRFLNVESDADFVLAVSWLLACLRNVGPYPLLVLAGEQGSAKSTFSGILRSLIDPNTAPLRALPREDRDLFIAANNGHVLAFDNVSGLPPWLSDTLCRLATGGGFAVRALYTDQDEVLFDATRPIILNGIEDVVTRQDLADRGLFLNLAPIPEERRRTESDLWRDFHTARPHLLGALLDAVVEGLRRLPVTQLDGLPRMADFALWATACEPALWQPGTFASAYRGNRDDAVDTVIESDPVAAAIRVLMAAHPTWSGSATELLAALVDVACDKVSAAKGWPGSAGALSGRLRRAAPFLRRVGIDIEHFKQGRARTKIIAMQAHSPREPEEEAKTAFPAPASSAPMPNPRQSGPWEHETVRTMNGAVDDEERPQAADNVRNRARETADADDADAADDEILTHSTTGTNGGGGRRYDRARHHQGSSRRRGEDADRRRTAGPVGAFPTG